MFFQILPRVDMQPRVLFPASDPLPVSAAPIPKPTQTAPPQFPQAVQQKLGEEPEHQVGGQVDTLIKEVQSRPILYKCRSSGVTNGEKKNAWNEISKVMKIPAEQCQIKWKALRDAYVKKKRMEENENPKGVSKKKWRLMQAMSFIDPYLRRYIMNNSNQQILPTEVNSTCPNTNLPLTEGNGDAFILGSDSTQPLEENSNNETVTVKLEPSSDDQSQEVVFEESAVPPIQSPSTSCEKEDSYMDPSSSVMEELLRCPKRKSKKRKADDPEDILEVAITKLLNEPAPPPEDYLDLRTKALCCLIRSRNFDALDQFEVLRQCEELVLNYKKKSS